MKPNREQRRHPEKLERPQDEPLARSTDAREDVLKPGNQDVADGRAKNSGHGKTTADKWNQ